MWLSGRWAALIVAALMVACGSAEAAGRRVINNYPVAVSGTGIKLPVAIADATIVYPIIKYLPQARVATALTNAIQWGGAAAVIGYAMIAEHNAETAGTLAYQNDQWVRAEEYQGSYTESTWKNSCTNATWGACVTQISNNINHFFGPSFGYGTPVIDSGSCKTTDSNGCSVGRVGYKRRNANGSMLDANWNYVEFGRVNVNYPAGYTPAAATEADVAEAVRGYSSPYEAREFYENPVSGVPENIMQAAHEPLPLSQQQLDQINDALRNGISQGMDALAEELAQFGREHGVQGSPDPVTVPDATQVENGSPSSNVSVTVNIEPDTPGNAFTEPTLETLESFATITQNFWTAVQGAPVVAAWTGISSSIPAASCPSAPITVFGVTHDFMDTFCEIWESAAVPLLAAVFLFVWPFLGLRYVLSA